MARLSDQEILELAEHIRNCTDPDECCHGLLIARQWLAKRYGQIDPGLIAWLNSQEVACDCELAHQLAASILKKLKDEGND